MDINSWLTVITVFTAFIALLPRESQMLLIHTTSKIEKIAFAIVNLLIIPLLIITPQIRQRWPSISSLGFSWGFEPPSIAFAIFYIVLLWSMWKLMVKSKNKKPSEKIIDFYLELLNEKPFPEFFKIFTNYTSPKALKEHWLDYNYVVMHPKFLAGGASFAVQFWDELGVSDTKKLFMLMLENPNSAYYTEIKENWNGETLQPDKPFLNKILNDHLDFTVGNNVVEMVEDFASRQIRDRKHTVLYNQKHVVNRIREDEGYDLPIYYHLRFYSLLHSKGIELKADVGFTISFYEQLIGYMIEDMPTLKHYDDKHVETNYTWLFNEIGQMYMIWLTTLSQKRDYTDYMSRIPCSFRFAFDKLVYGLKKGKFTNEVLFSFTHYSILSVYYDKHNNDFLRQYIEDDFIKEANRDFFIPVLRKSLNEEFAISAKSFVDGSFHPAHEFEKEILTRLRSFMMKNNILRYVA